MRSRIGCGIALGLLAGLGGTGCATSTPRADAPLPFRNWWAPAASKPSTDGAGLGSMSRSLPSPNASIVSPANRPTFPWSEPTGPAKTTLSGWNWRYKPGSLFRKPAKVPATAPAPAPTTGSDGSLARFFPGLYGQNGSDPDRLAAARRPPQAARLGDGAIVTTRGTRSPAAAAGDDVSTLPVAIEAHAYPGSPSAAIDRMTRLARRDRPAAADERLTSHEEPAAPPLGTPHPRPRAMSRPMVQAPVAPHESSMDDAMTAELDGLPAAAATPRPSPSDPAGRPVSAGAHVPAGALRLAQGAPAAGSDEEDGPDLRIDPIRAVPATRPRPALAATPERPRPAAAPAPERPRPVVAAASPAARPRRIRAEPMELPPAEFPATYHTESLRMVLRERERGPAPAADPDPRPGSSIEGPEARKPVLLPWLARLWPRPAEDDRAVIPTSARREVAGASGTVGTIDRP